MSWIHYAIIFGIISAFGAMTIWALWWAMRAGQFSDFQRGATSIFDEEEPVGKRTDGFPDEQRQGET